nr:tRNA dihydrouridine(20/20a) synthase DusA [Oceanococcus sp. HetDA_MAG_MS8]
MTDTKPPHIDASPWRFSVAPMMDWTTSECRQFHRLLSKRARLYTEMVTTGALRHGDVQRHLGYQPEEHPLALQLGGSDSQDLAFSARLAEDYGYAEVNLNCGCPSDRVRNGRFGACLMAEPEVVAEAVSAMQAAVRIPVTVKCRLGIDELDSEEHLHHFVGQVHSAGCHVFIVHARKAWLQGLSPKQNREVPPLDYARVGRLKQAFPDCVIVLNGGLSNLQQAEDAMRDYALDGVMLGRAAYQNPWLLHAVDQRFFAETPVQGELTNPLDIAPGLRQLLQAIEEQGRPPRHLLRHTLGLFNGQPGAKLWRRRLSQPLASGEGLLALDQALNHLKQELSRHAETAFS